jgi:dTDP-glucose 4,6-dehydratase
MEGVDAVVNFAAETHVDRSIAEPDAFVRRTRPAPTSCSRPRAHGRALPAGLHRRGLRLDRGGLVHGVLPLAPSSPYSATKAGADLLVASYFHTFGLETLICRGSNNYGPYQYPEKLIR